MENIEAIKQEPSEEIKYKIEKEEPEDNKTIKSEPKIEESSSLEQKEIEKDPLLDEFYSEVIFFYSL